MRSVRGLLLVSVVMGVLVVGVIASSAAAKPQTLSFLEVDTAFTGIGGYNLSGSAPPTAGQGVTFSGTLYTWAGAKRGAVAGHVHAICTVTAGNPTVALCLGDISLPSGTIELLGPTNFGNAPGDVPVVGGTGAYVGARGYMHSANIGGGNSSRSSDVIHLLG